MLQMLQVYSQIYMTEDDTFKVLKRKVSFPEMCRIMLGRDSDGVPVDDLLAQYGWDKEDMFKLVPSFTLADFRKERT